MGQLLARDAGRVRLRAAAERVGLVDGAVCLRTHLSNLPLEAVPLDFYHLSEHVNDAMRKTLGEKTDMPYEDGLTKADASKRIDALRGEAGLAGK